MRNSFPALLLILAGLKKVNLKRNEGLKELIVNRKWFLA